MIVPDYQLSLAIGREGQNARLAARLTGWRIDIRSDAQPTDDAAGLAGRRSRSAAPRPAGWSAPARAVRRGVTGRPCDAAEHPGSAAR